MSSLNSDSNGVLSSPVRCLLLIAAGYIVFVIGTVVYRLFFHPLSRFPGPKRAAVSYLYEGWFDIVQGGGYTRQIATLHEKYGPIIRINPDELHCNDAAFLSTIYIYGARKRNKSTHYTSGQPFGMNKAGVGTNDHDLHRLRRAPINNFFSRPAILNFENVIQNNVNRLCEKFLLHRGKEPFDVAAAYSCFSTDTIGTFLFNRDMENLTSPGWNPTFKGVVDSMTSAFYLSRHFPLVAKLMERIPISVTCALSPEVGSIISGLEITIPQLCRDAASPKSEKVTEKSHPTFIQALLKSDLPPAEKAHSRLVSEAKAVVVGGTHTTSVVLAIATYHLLSNPALLERLRSEIQDASSDSETPMTWTKLEKLPFLSAVILEATRLMYGIAARISMVAPEEDLVYRCVRKGSNGSPNVEVCHKIPRGYAIGMSTYLIHTDPKIYPDPLSFVPERWLDESGQQRKDLKQYFMAFSKGNRNCPGQHLAYCELYLTLAAMVTRVMPNMVLYETTIADVEYDHDQMIYLPKKGSKGIRVAMV